MDINWNKLSFIIFNFCLSKKKCVAVSRQNSERDRGTERICGRAQAREQPVLCFLER